MEPTQSKPKAKGDNTKTVKPSVDNKDKKAISFKIEDFFVDDYQHYQKEESTVSIDN